MQGDKQPLSRSSTCLPRMAKDSADVALRTWSVLYGVLQACASQPRHPGYYYARSSCTISGAAVWSCRGRKAFAAAAESQTTIPLPPLLSGAEAVHPENATPKGPSSRFDKNELAAQHQRLLLSKQVHIYNEDPLTTVGLIWLLSIATPAKLTLGNVHSQTIVHQSVQTP
jgi:hypothetical protein